MLKPQVLIKSTPWATRLLATYGEDEILRAALPPPTPLHPRAAATLLEGLSLWYQRQVRVVLYADAQGVSCGLGLCDGLGSRLRAPLEHRDVGTLGGESHRDRATNAGATTSDECVFTGETLG